MVRVRRAIIGGLIVLGLVVGRVTAPTTVTVPQEPIRLVSVITTDGRDLDLVVSRSGAVQPIAPLMDWENLDIRERRPITFCAQSHIPDQIVQNFRTTLNTINSWYGLSLSVKKGCTGPYTVTDTAQIDCGIGDQAVACAVYRGTRSGQVSYNGNLYRTGRLSDRGVRVGLAHEVGHIFNLGHTQCGGDELGTEISAMSPIYLPDGPTCRGAYDVVREDWKKAEEYYGLSPRIGPDLTPTPTPVPRVQGSVRFWQWNGVDWSIKEQPFRFEGDHGWIDVVTESGDWQGFLEVTGR